MIQKLHKYIPVNSAVLLMAILRLVHNLAFDSAARAELVASGMVPKLVDIMQEPRYGLPLFTRKTPATMAASSRGTGQSIPANH